MILVDILVWSTADINKKEIVLTF